MWASTIKISKFKLTKHQHENDDAKINGNLILLFLFELQIVFLWCLQMAERVEKLSGAMEECKQSQATLQRDIQQIKTSTAEKTARMVSNESKDIYSREDC